MDIQNQIKELGDKLAATQSILNGETSSRAHGDALSRAMIDALAKVQAEDHADTNSRIDATGAVLAALMADVAAIKLANDTAGLAHDVATMRSVLTQLIEALNAEDDGSEDSE